MIFLRLLPVILSSFLLGAHFSRANMNGLAIAFLLLPLLLFVKNQGIARLFQIVLLVGMVVWIETTVRLVQLRQAAGESWTRLAIILGAVALFTGLSTLLFETKALKAHFKKKV